ncbi:hypothetical protein [Nocardia arthritidis]|uniref:Uncharacterized protein n=1 Tax=Nocardia arthritidis TaxID=228602 RepID=A0A6G9YK59_9NOCA|nr:hypothetical protein [Nocardia arthritidis]QIS13426.1 hypothetical protein F5544_27865 [Nocardia arthritidis]
MSAAQQLGKRESIGGTEVRRGLLRLMRRNPRLGHRSAVPGGTGMHQEPLRASRFRREMIAAEPLGRCGPSGWIKRRYRLFRLMRRGLRSRRTMTLVWMVRELVWGSRFRRKASVVWLGDRCVFRH